MPSEGGWTLVVASRTNADEAESIRTQFASALESARVPVDVLTSETGDGTTRYRVVVGQFSSQNEAQLIKQEYSDVVPDDAWPLQL
jgi:cell division protein FtsN